MYIRLKKQDVCLNARLEVCHSHEHEKTRDKKVIHCVSVRYLFIS